MKIKHIDAFQIYDSRGNPTVEAEVILENGAIGHGLVPSGASTGQYEAWELRDGERRFRGRSVFQAVKNIQKEICPKVRGMDASSQREIDEAMVALDGTANKSRLGANAIFGVSMAVADAAARTANRPLFDYLGEGTGTLLPLPEIQIIGGGAHANWRTDVQDFMLIATGAKHYAEVMEITFNVFQAAGDIMRERGRYFGAADEGGYWPEFHTNEEALDTWMEAVRRSGYTPGKEASLSLDIAASDLYDQKDRSYRFGLENRVFSSEAFVDLMIEWCERYPIISIEDPAADSDWAGWKRFYDACGRKVQVIGDDLFTTNMERINVGIEKGLANAVLIKLNQIGTVTETLDAIRLTQKAGWLPVVSARSGETEDAFISHLAIATNAGQLKVGSFCRSERMVKWNECLRVERLLGSRARFLGTSIYGGIFDAQNPFMHDAGMTAEALHWPTGHPTEEGSGVVNANLAAIRTRPFPKK